MSGSTALSSAPSLARTERHAPSARRRTLARAVGAGWLALWSRCLHLLSDRPLFVLALLAAMLTRVPHPAAATSSRRVHRLVLAYNAMHLVVVVAIGMGWTALARVAWGTPARATRTLLVLLALALGVAARGMAADAPAIAPVRAVARASTVAAGLLVLHALARRRARRTRVAAAG